MSLERRNIDILTMGRSGIDIFLSRLASTSKMSRPSESSLVAARRTSPSPPRAGGQRWATEILLHVDRL